MSCHRRCVSWRFAAHSKWVNGPTKRKFAVHCKSLRSSTEWLFPCCLMPGPLAFCALHILLLEGYASYSGLVCRMEIYLTNGRSRSVPSLTHACATHWEGLGAILNLASLGSSLDGRQSP